MDDRDREAIQDLFGKLGDVERQAGPRDAEAERFIADQVARLPGAPYYMAQTIVMQDMALANQHARIEQLERDLASRPDGGGGMLSRMFGGAGSTPRSVPSVGGGKVVGSAWGGAAGAAAGQQNNASPYGEPPMQGQGQGRNGMASRMGGMGGGGFLAGAAQTAMGVAGGVLLGNAVMGMFSDNEAQAAETPADDTSGVETGAEATPASDDGGGWFGGDDGGGFDDI